jgi:superfamily I DNA/RNA helicase
MLELGSLNPQQRLAVETLQGPVLILAGAGTGKTRVITFRVAHLVARGASPGAILAVTFTNKAAREMQERVRKLLPAPRRNGETPSERPTICTFHSLCVRILRQHIEKLGYKRNFVIYNESEQLGAIKKVLSQISVAGKNVDPKVILSVLSREKNGGGRAWGNETSAPLAGHVREKYQSALHACNAVDFDDLLLLTLQLFEQHPDTLKTCRERYRFVMVDEYQDTNAAQFKLVQLLTAEHRNLCVVGDDDQSIYGWRGAQISNLLDLEKFFPEVKIIKLEQNYRSTNAILGAANALIKNNTRRRGKQLWSKKGEGARILLEGFADEQAEARSVVEQIEYARQIKRVSWSAQAVLFRTNQQSKPLETALRQAGVAYHLIGGQSFFDRREVKDFIAYLKLLVNPHDDVSLLRIVNVPARGLSEATMERLLAASQERKCSVYSAMTNPAVQISFASGPRERIEGFVGLVEKTRSSLLAGARPLGEWAEAFLAEISYPDELRRTEKNAEAAESRIRNLKELIGDLNGCGNPQSPGLERIEKFLEELTLDEERLEDRERTGEAITLITMHSCKGLEFPHVWIVGLEDGLLPHSRSADEGTLEEERRLFYVAITRAMESLNLSYCRGRRKYGELAVCHPSPFLKELPEELIERADHNAAKAVSVDSGKDFFASLRANLA